MAQPQIPSVTIELEDNKVNVAIDDVTPEFLQLIFDLEITPKLLKNSAGMVIPIIKQKLYSNVTYTIVTSLGSKSRKNQKIQSSVVSPPKYEEKKEKSETKDKDGNTPLLLASKEGNLDTVKGAVSFAFLKLMGGAGP